MYVNVKIFVLLTNCNLKSYVYCAGKLVSCNWPKNVIYPGEEIISSFLIKSNDTFFSTSLNYDELIE